MHTSARNLFSDIADRPAVVLFNDQRSCHICSNVRPGDKHVNNEVHRDQQSDAFHWQIERHKDGGDDQQAAAGNAGTVETQYPDSECDSNRFWQRKLDAVQCRNEIGATGAGQGTQRNRVTAVGSDRPAVFWSIARSRLAARVAGSAAGRIGSRARSPVPAPWFWQTARRHSLIARESGTACLPAGQSGCRSGSKTAQQHNRFCAEIGGNGQYQREDSIGRQRHHQAITTNSASFTAAKNPTSCFRLCGSIFNRASANIPVNTISGRISPFAAAENGLAGTRLISQLLKGRVPRSSAAEQSCASVQPTDC